MGKRALGSGRTYNHWPSPLSLRVHALGRGPIRKGDHAMNKYTHRAWRSCKQAQPKQYLPSFLRRAPEQSQRKALFIAVPV